MPTYEYACPKCGHRFEQVQSMRDEPLKRCPKCKKAGLKRLFGLGVGMIFKGAASSKTPAPGSKSAFDATASHNRDHKNERDTHHGDHDHHH
jgi:putative FmdB family regulatory protein